MEAPRGDYCARTFRWIPCIFIILVIVWSYYAFVVELCLFTLESTIQKVLYIVFYQFFFFMLVWAYWQTIFTDPRNPSSKYTLPEGMYERMVSAADESAKQEIIREFASSLPGMELRTMQGGYRHCAVTARLKPDRCHYCSVIKQCVLKMDHYCPWVNNCVGWSNYKFFVLFLFYGLLYCIFMAATTFHYFTLFWSNDLKASSFSKFNILFLFLASAMFALSLTTLFSYHIWLTSKNRTTIESWRAPIFRSGPDMNGFNLGAKRNFEQVFGEKPLLWGLPIFTSLGDGQSFPVRLMQGDVESGLATNRLEEERKKNLTTLKVEEEKRGSGEKA